MPSSSSPSGSRSSSSSPSSPPSSSSSSASSSTRAFTLNNSTECSNFEMRFPDLGSLEEQTMSSLLSDPKVLKQLKNRPI